MTGGQRALTVTGVDAYTDEESTPSHSKSIQTSLGITGEQISKAGRGSRGGTHINGPEEPLPISITLFALSKMPCGCIG